MAFTYLISSDIIGYQDPELANAWCTASFWSSWRRLRNRLTFFFGRKGCNFCYLNFSAVDALKILAEESGMTLLACVTWLDYYGIKDKIEVGKASTMPEIIAVMHESDTVIHI